MLRNMKLGAVVAAAWLTASPVTAATVITNANGDAVRIEKLQVGTGLDSFFDVVWLSGELNEVYGNDVIDFPFPEQRETTEEAANAIAQALQDEGTIGEIVTPQPGNPDLRTSFFAIPYQIEQMGIGGPEAAVWFVDRQNNDAPFIWGPATEDTSFPPTTDTAWAIFTPTTPPSAVPVPAAAWLFGSGLLGLTGIARRKKTA